MKNALDRFKITNKSVDTWKVYITWVLPIIVKLLFCKFRQHPILKAVKRLIVQHSITLGRLGLLPRIKNKNGGCLIFIFYNKER